MIESCSVSNKAAKDFADVLSTCDMHDRLNLMYVSNITQNQTTICRIQLFQIL